MDFLRIANKIASVDDMLLNEIQQLMNDHWDPDLKGTPIDPKDVHEIGNYLVIFSDYVMEHIKERHKTKSSPGSYLDPSVNIKEVAFDIIKSKSPTENSEKFTNWFGVDLGRNVGFMGVALTTPEEANKMEMTTVENKLPNDTIKKEIYPVSRGKRLSTSVASVISSKVGELSNGKMCIYIVTMYAGGDSVNGEKIPRERSEFADKGFYFVVE